MKAAIEPLLTPAIARLCAVLRSLGQEATYIERYQDNGPALGDQLDGAADDCRAQAARVRADVLDGAAVDQLVTALRLDATGAAAAWLADAVEAATVEDAQGERFRKPYVAEHMAKVALELLAWSEALLAWSEARTVNPASTEARPV